MTPTLKLAVFAVSATLAYLGLAILGWGGFAGFFSHPALIALASTLFVLTGVALFSGGNLSPGEREDRTNRWVIAALGVIGVLAAYLPAYTDRKEFWTVDGDAVRWLGVVLFAAVVCCDSGRCLCSATGSAGWSPSSRGTGWSRAVFMASSATRAISGCWSTRWGGLSPSGPSSACCLPRFLSRRLSPAYAPKRGCCARNSATSTTSIAAAPRG